LRFIVGPGRLRDTYNTHHNVSLCGIVNTWRIRFIGATKQQNWSSLVNYIRDKISVFSRIIWNVFILIPRVACKRCYIFIAYSLSKPDVTFPIKLLFKKKQKNILYYCTSISNSVQWIVFLSVKCTRPAAVTRILSIDGRRYLFNLNNNGVDAIFHG